MTPTDSLAARIAAYRNDAAHNEALYREFTRLADAVPFLKRHRDWVEVNRWGYGDRAFHYLWLLLLGDLAATGGPVSALEIGVYKGQTISLWALVARECGFDVRITALSPFEGNLPRQPRLLRRLRMRLDRRYREACLAGNLHRRDDYLRRCREIFEAFGLDFEAVRVIRGYSNDPVVAARLAGERFALVYIDGDHSLEVARSDIATYGPLVAPGGYLVMDDAGCFLPGSGYFKGLETVSVAAEDIPALGFENVLNVGHNRVYRRRPARAREGAGRVP
ncbi:MAG TPA: class I SAM-dependent methyltransferase [Thermodesulfobacteriota bacterium]|nr:class I SAM-dependent methyltransferase [Thermodesulfobacteriota bacterium]